jgi:hypothetical protein
MDQTINSYANNLMCSTFCKCQTDLAKPWVDLGEEALQLKNRTLTPAGGAPQDADEKWVFVTRASAPASEELYSKFSDCNTYLQGQYEADTTPEKTEYGWVPHGSTIDMGIKVITFFEAKYTCSGICNPALFYYTLDLSEGIPTSSCLQYLKSEIGDRMSYLGITAIIIGVLMMLVFVVQYALWCNYK